MFDFQEFWGSSHVRIHIVTWWSKINHLTLRISLLESPSGETASCALFILLDFGHQAYFIWQHGLHVDHAALLTQKHAVWLQSAHFPLRETALLTQTETGEQSTVHESIASGLLYCDKESFWPLGQQTSDQMIPLLPFSSFLHGSWNDDCGEPPSLYPILC